MSVFEFELDGQDRSRVVAILYKGERLPLTSAMQEIRKLAADIRGLSMAELLARDLEESHRDGNLSTEKLDGVGEEALWDFIYEVIPMHLAALLSEDGKKRRGGKTATACCALGYAFWTFLQETDAEPTDGMFTPWDGKDADIEVEDMPRSAQEARSELKDFMKCLGYPEDEVAGAISALNAALRGEWGAMGSIVRALCEKNAARQPPKPKPFGEGVDVERYRLHVVLDVSVEKTPDGRGIGLTPEGMCNVVRNTLIVLGPGDRRFSVIEQGLQAYARNNRILVDVASAEASPLP